MKFEKPANPNYCATVVRIQSLNPLQNCDNVLGTTIFGFQAIVSKATEVGTLGVFFPAETQLSEEYCKENNLYRHEEYNKDPMHKGYIEDNRRVKAIKFRGNTSNGLFMPLESLSYVVDVSKLEEGDEFDAIDGKEICRKYEVRRRESRGAGNQAPKPRRVDQRHFPEHFSTENYFRNDRNIAQDQEIIVTQKLHGTSIRIANTIVNRKLTLVDKIAKFFGANIQMTTFDYVFGSRKVTKDPNNPDQNHYYEQDIWTLEGKKLEGLIPENFLVFGELIGWTPDGAPIQEGYVYGLPKGTCRLYIYRVAFVNDKGLVVDLSWDHVKEFCRERNLQHVPELLRVQHQVFDVKALMDCAYKNQFDVALPVQEGTVDEGICIRVESIVPKIYKAKSPLFFEYETKLLDKGKEDLESIS